MDSKEPEEQKKADRILGWDSPIGVGIFLVCLALAGYLGVLALITLRGY